MEKRKIDETIWIDGSSVEEAYANGFEQSSEFIVDKRTKMVYRRGDGP